MGLVVQTPIDPLLAISETAAVPPLPGPGTAEDGLFASLLASLSASVAGSAAELGAAAAMPSDAEAGQPAEGENKERDTFAAMVAVSVPLQVLPPAIVTELSAPAAAAGEAVGSKGAAPAIPLAVEALPAEVQPGGEAAPAAVPERQKPGAPLVPGEPTAALALVQPSSADALAEVAPPATPAPVEAQERPEPLAGAKGPPVDAIAANDSSVVRTVGNANTEEKADSGNRGQGDGPHVERPQPRPSAQGLAHAAVNSAVGELRTTQSAPADAPAPPPAAVAAPDMAPPAEQVATTVIEQVDAGGGEAKIHLNPVELGEVTIRVHADGEHVRLEIRAERQEAMHLLRDHAQDLSSLLGERGLNLSDVNVGLGRGNGDQAWAQDGRPQSRPAAGEFAAILGVDEAPAANERHQRLRAAYNPDGAHMYRV